MRHIRKEWRDVYFTQREEEGGGVLRYQPRNQEPTHHVEHNGGPWSVDLPISESIQKGLASPDDKIRQSAEHHVAVQFRKACEKQYRGPGQFNLKQVSFRSLDLRPLDGANALVGSAAPIE